MSPSQQGERTPARAPLVFGTRRNVLCVNVESAKGIQTESDVIDMGEVGFFPGCSWETLYGSATAIQVLGTKGASTQLVPIDESAYWELVDAGVRTTAEPSRWFRYVWDRLDQLESGGNHDDPGEPYPTPLIVSYAREVAQKLFTPRTPTPSVVPSDNGGVAFVWHKGGA